MNGTDLKVLRTRAHVKAKDLAARLGWSASKISRIEAAAWVAEDDATRYVAELATFSATATDSASTSAA